MNITDNTLTGNNIENVRSSSALNHSKLATTQIFCILLLTISITLFHASNSLASVSNSSKSSTNSTKNDVSHKCVNELSNNLIFNNDMVIGNKNAKVIVIEYFAPTCTHCSEYHAKVFPELKRKYIDTGKIAYVMREFVGNKQDLDASILARCSVDNEGYLKLMEVILSRQEEWAYNKNYRQYLVDIGAQGGITEEQYKKCLAGDSWTEVFIKNAKLAVNTPNFIGTPSFFINGELISATLSKEQFFNKIEQELNI